tara:strand:+ start:1618 stop:2553 length:936 start_codon:yes stop_codon:yes gene_type:complete
MAFLDNSGDIILDAVLTDLGRKRLAEGNGRFRIDKFALGDDEIDYGLYDKNNTSGSAYYDISILQTPVLEAFTNNMSSMKSRLISYTSNDLLYLPVIQGFNDGDSGVFSTFNSHVVLVDSDTINALSTNANALTTGLLNGFEPGKGVNTVAADQGIDSSELGNEEAIDPQLVESQFFVQIDNRLGSIVPAISAIDSTSYTAVSIDDDNIATYIFTLDDDSGAVEPIEAGAASSIVGPRGNRIKFKLQSSLDLKTNTFLFNQLGQAGTSNIVNGTKTLAAANYRFIDTNVRVSGVSTGYTLDIPVRFVKKTS